MKDISSLSFITLKESHSRESSLNLEADLEQVWKVDVSKIPFGLLSSREGPLLAVEPNSQDIVALQQMERQLDLKPNSIVKKIPHSTEKTIQVVISKVNQKDLDLIRKIAKTGCTSIYIKPNYSQIEQQIEFHLVATDSPNEKPVQKRRHLPYGKRLRARD